MIITISGTPGSGKSTLAKFLAKRLKFKLYLVGEMVRDIAGKKGLSIFELDKMAAKDSSIDKEIDKIHKKMTGKNLVIDSRIAFNFFPASLKLFLYCRPEIAAKRIFRARRLTEKMNSKRILQEIKQRNKIDILRYKRCYHLNIDDLDNYDLIIDTSKMRRKEMNKVAFNAVQILMNKLPK